MKDRVIEFLAYLGIGQKKFERNCGLSNGFVDKIGDNITLKSINKIEIAYPDLNLVWLRTGKGTMLLSQQNEVNEPRQLYNQCPECRKKDEEIKKWRDKYDQMTAKYLAVLEEIKDKKVS